MLRSIKAQFDFICCFIEYVYCYILKETNINLLIYYIKERIQNLKKKFAYLFFIIYLFLKKQNN